MKKSRLFAGLFGLVIGVPSAFAQSYAPGSVAWQRLSLGASTLFGSIVTDIELRAIPTEDARPALLESPRGTAIQPGGADIYELVLRGEVKHALVSANEAGSAWFDPQTGAALKRVRTRAGKKANEKRYRFTDAGVYRLRKKPDGAAENELGPAAWSKEKESFYPFAPPAAGCPNVTEAAVLLYLVSTGGAMAEDSLCVFSRRDLFQVRLRSDGAESISLEYVETVSGVSSRRGAEVRALRYRLEVERALSSNSDSSFQFLGLGGDVQVLVNAETRVPVQVRGTVSGFGEVQLNLLALTRSQD